MGCTVTAELNRRELSEGEVETQYTEVDGGECFGMVNIYSYQAS